MITSRQDILLKLASDIHAYSPIVIQGESGVGKSFFLHALCEQLIKNQAIKNYKVLYAWEIQNDIIDALSNSSINTWRQRFQASDVIAIDEFQYTRDKLVMSELLYQELRSTNKPIILTTTVPIISNIFENQDLVSLCREGIPIILEAPTQDELIWILKMKLQACSICITVEAWEWLKTQNIAALGSVNSMIKILKCNCEEGTAIDLDLCQKLMKPILAYHMGKALS